MVVWERSTFRFLFFTWTQQHSIDIEYKRTAIHLYIVLYISFYIPVRSVPVLGSPTLTFRIPGCGRKKVDPVL